MQSIWKGAISFGLVSIPIRLYAATEERSVSLHQVHAKDAGRIRYKRVCSVDGEEVAYSDIAKGYETADGEIVVLTDEDMAELPLVSSRAIEVLSFLPADDIDPVQLSKSYYCDPTGPDAKPYVLLRDALVRTGKVAVVKVALRQRESLATLRPRDGVLVLQTMLWPDEVRQPRFAFLDSDVSLRPQEVQMAESYVETLTGEVPAEEMLDRYRVALEQLVAAKVAGREVERPQERVDQTGTVVDLMEALRRSVAEARRTRGGETSGDAAGETGSGDEAEGEAPARRSGRTPRKTAAAPAGEPTTTARKTAPKRMGKTAAQPASKTASKTASKPASKPASKAADQPASKAAGKTASRTAGKPPGNSSSKTAAKAPEKRAARGGARRSA